MKDKGLKKEPRVSWIEVKVRVHSFTFKDKMHPQITVIYEKLEELTKLMKEEGYVPDKNFVLHDVEDQSKEKILSYHSEKLAKMFGVISIPGRIPIRIIKNHHVFGDFHTASKLIYKIAGR